MTANLPRLARLARLRHLVRQARTFAVELWAMGDRWQAEIELIERELLEEASVRQDVREVRRLAGSPVTIQEE